MKFVFAAGVVAAASLALAGQASAATNLILNGSFETGDFTNWTYTGAGDDVPGHQATIITYNNTLGYPQGAFNELIPPDNSANPSPDAVGDHAAYFVADHSNESLSQMVHLLPGLYTIGFSVYVPQNGFDNSGDATFTGTVAGVNLANFNAHAVAAQQWFHFAGVANIVTEGDYLSSFTYNSGTAPAADFVIDRAYIVAGDVTGGVPEPATWALMILGFGSAGAMLRRRRTIFA